MSCVSLAEDMDFGRSDIVQPMLFAGWGSSRAGDAFAQRTASGRSWLSSYKHASAASFPSRVLKIIDAHGKQLFGLLDHGAARDDHHTVAGVNGGVAARDDHLVAAQNGADDDAGG